MKRSDEILQKAFGRGLTMSERMELREAYNWEQSQDDSSRHQIKRSVKEYKDDKDALNMPRHRVLNKFPHMRECPICFRMTGYNTAVIKEARYMEQYPDDFCMKPQIHNERSYEMMITRERIDLDARP